jgi:hypothetical protein
MALCNTPLPESFGLIKNKQLRLVYKNEKGGI